VAGFATQAALNNLIANESFTSSESMSCMTNNNDVNEMAKHSMSHAVTDGRIIMGTAATKQIQGLVLWIKDHCFCGLPITAEAFTVEEMENAMMNKEYHKEMAEATKPLVKSLGKFNPDDFEIHPY
jgi:hypothetical protein